MLAALVARTGRMALALLFVLSVAPAGLGAPQPVLAATITMADLNCVDFVDENVGYAAGTGGTVLRTLNGGVSWRVMRSGDSLNLRGISFVTATRGWVVSAGGTILGTTDAGETWTTLSADLTGGSYIGDFHDLHFFSDTFGRTTGGAQDMPPVVFRTYTGGNGSWNLEVQAGTYEPPPERPPWPKVGLGEFYAFDFLSEGRGWAVGHDRYNGANKPVIWDHDETRGGTTWLAQTVSGTGPLYDVSFSSTSTGIAVGSGGKVYRTANAGSTWTASTVGGTGHDHWGVAFGADGEAWTVGKWGLIFRTVDSGANWTQLASPPGSGYQLNDVAWLGGTTAVAVGKSGTIIRTTNGIDWSLVSNPAPPAVTSFTSTSHPASTWTASATVDLEWTATGTDIEGYALEFDSSTSTAPSSVNESGTSASRVASASGVWYGHVRARDAVGQWSTTAHREVWVDVDAPTPTFEPEPTGYESRAEVPLAATDAHSGVADISYEIDGGPTVTVPASETTVTIETPGDHTVTYRALDEAGNVAPTQAATVTVYEIVPDAPEITSFTSASHPPATWVATTTVEFSWTATGTDIEGYALVLDGSPGTLPSALDEIGTSATRTAPGSGVWYGHVRARDAHEQWSGTSHREVRVDVDAPTVAFEPDPAGYEAIAQVDLSATDQHSQVALVSYEIDGGATITEHDDATVVTIDEAGEHTVTYRAVDHAGNVSATGTAVVSVYFLPEGDPVEGRDRYATALTASALAFETPMAPGPDGHRWVVVASGANWPDALAASGLAGAVQGPLLLTKPTSLPTTVRDHIVALGADRVAIVGGVAAVSEDVEAGLAGLVGSANVERYGESNRYTTAARIAEETVGATGRAAWDGVAFMATGANFPDALAAAPLSAAKGRPLYLAHPDKGVSDATVASMKALGVTRVIVLGGTSVVSEASVAKVRAAGITIGDGDRWAGRDRYATARQVAEESIAEGLGTRHAGLATGENYPDALAGGVAQGLTGSVLMLSKSASLSTPARAFFEDHAGGIEHLRFFGGTVALSEAVRAQALAAATP